jgi:hypothetical protein
MKKPRRASIDEVHITRDDENAIIEFINPTISIVHIRLGPRVGIMIDVGILETFNDIIDARDEVAVNFEKKVIEFPVGNPQIEYSSDADQCMPRGTVLRCHLEDDSRFIGRVGRVVSAGVADEIRRCPDRQG